MRERPTLLATQESRFGRLASAVLASNPFYRAKYEPLGFSSERPPTLADLPSLPFTDKRELASDQASHPPFGTDLTLPVESYSRVHLTSGTSGRPLRWLDDPASWQVMLDCWHDVYRAAGVGASDRIFVAFSFGPFLGFWTAFEAAQQLGALTIPGGGLSSVQRLDSIIAHEASVLVCTPTYALRLVETARQEGLDLASTPLRITIHGGEPGASLPNVKSTLETAFGARCYDHSGATEVGPWGFDCGAGYLVHVNEREFIAEVVDPESLRAVEPDADGIAAGELVLTGLRRIGSPVIRYRTGDFVRLTRRPCRCGSECATLLGGVLSRLDDMMIVRGVNIYPSALENLVRELREIDEFEVVAVEERGMAELVLRIEVEPDLAADIAERLARTIRDRLGVRPTVEVVEPGTLTRYEAKSRRFSRRDR